MKIEVMRTVEIDVKRVRITVPVNYGEEDIPADFPFRENDLWSCVVDVETGIIVDWPLGFEYDLSMKVVDGGMYELLGVGNETISSIQDYVPHGLIPGEYGDYIEFNITADGRIANWPVSPDVSAFFE
jgi:hypothetical protein